MKPFKQSTNIYQLSREMLKETGVNPLAIYCQSTGAILGYIRSSEAKLLWDSLDPKLDRGEIIDELYGRTIHSMRPSPAWNYIRKGTLNRLRVSDPIRVCSYLLGRYYEPRDKAYSRVRRSYESRIQDGITRIQIFQKLTEQDYDIHRLKEFTTILLMIDSSFDLSLIQMFNGFPKTPMDINMNVIESYTKQLNEEYLRLTDLKLKLEKKAQLDASVLARGGNRMTRDVAHQAFMEIKPKSDAQIAKDNKHQVEVLMTNLLRELMDGESTRVEKHIPQITKPFKVGFKLGGFKK